MNNKKHTTSTKIKMSKIRIKAWKEGKYDSLETKQKRINSHKGKISGMKGKFQTEKTKEKISKANKGKISNRKGIKLSNETKRKISIGNKGKNIGHAPTNIKPNKTSFKKGSCGNKCVNWKGGITPINKLLRLSSKYKIWREAVFLRDNFTCQNTNCKYCNNKIGVFLHPHHIKSFALYPELRFNINNGITYCDKFHINSKLLHKAIRSKKCQQMV